MTLQRGTTKPQRWALRGNGLVAPDLLWVWQSLEGLWPFWEGGGDTVHDVSGKGVHGAAASTTHAWTTTRLGLGTAHSGNDGWNMGDPAAIQFLAAEQWTAWSVSAMTTQPGDGQGFYSRYGGSSSNRQFLIWYHNAGRVEVYGSDDTLRISGNAVTLGHYNFVAVTCDGSGQIALWTYDLTARQWIDQGTTGSHADVGSPRGANFYLGDMEQSPAPFLGEMVVAGYNRQEMRASQIERLAYSPFGPFRMGDLSSAFIFSALSAEEEAAQNARAFWW